MWGWGGGVGGGVTGTVKCAGLMFHCKNNVGCDTLVLRGKVFPFSAFVRPFAEFRWFPIILLKK